MDQAVPVSVVQPVGHIAGDAEGVLQRKLVLALEAIPQRLPRHERHDVVELALEFPGIQQAEDVGMLEAGSGGNFAKEAVGTEYGGDVRQQCLDRDRAVVLEVPG
jgi:hypothetical protein